MINISNPNEVSAVTIEELVGMLVILVGNSKKDKLYALLSVDKDKAFDKDMIRRLKALGVTVKDIRNSVNPWTEDELLG